MGKIKNIMAARCEHCPLCKYARNHPENRFGKLMHWHGKWCPFWKAREEQYADKN
ncbi:MAG: hypothetical protein ABIA63_13595 [bacterium]